MSKIQGSEWGETRTTIRKYIKEHGQIRWSEARDILGTSKRKTVYVLDRLRRESVIAKIGWGAYSLNGNARSSSIRLVEQRTARNASRTEITAHQTELLLNSLYVDGMSFTAPEYHLRKNLKLSKAMVEDAKKQGYINCDADTVKITREGINWLEALEEGFI